MSSLGRRLRRRLVAIPSHVRENPEPFKRGDRVVLDADAVQRWRDWYKSDPDYDFGMSDSRFLEALERAEGRCFTVVGMGVGFLEDEVVVQLEDPFEVTAYVPDMELPLFWRFPPDCLKHLDELARLEVQPLSAFRPGEVVAYTTDVVEAEIQDSDEEVSLHTLYKLWDHLNDNRHKRFRVVSCADGFVVATDLESGEEVNEPVDFFYLLDEPTA